MKQDFTSQATFAGGCFWCLQGPFDAKPGVSEVEVGYAGGSKQDASYEKVSTGRTGHREAIRMRFDPRRIKYQDLLQIFFQQIDPTDPYGQFADQGNQYTTAIYYHTEEQKQKTKNYIQELNASKKFQKPIVTRIVPFTTFFQAEENHQSYYKKNPIQYQLYARGSGRKTFLEKNL